MTYTLPPMFVCAHCGHYHAVTEDRVANTIPELHAVSVRCRLCDKLTHIQLIEDAAYSSTPPSGLSEGQPTGPAAAGPQSPPALPAAAPVIHNCCDCGSGWQADYAGAHWGRCFVMEMRTPARGAGCRNNWTAKEGHGRD